jgi:hypothetical protein
MSDDMKKEISKELIIKFLENKCGREEAERVHQYLMEHPGVLDEHVNEEEWELFTAAPIVPDHRSDVWLQYIQEHKQEKKSFLLWRPLLRVAAAVLLLTAGGGTLYYLLQPAARPASPVATRIIYRPAAKEKLFINNGSEPVTDTLYDGSVVRLYKNSVLACLQPFDSAKRELRLQGEAVFFVAKDTQRPFTVFTDGFSTTALGTAFRVSAYSSGPSSVKLLSGRVVVRNLQSAAAPVYLQPGDACTFNKADHLLHFHSAETSKPASVEIKVNGDIRETEDEIAFSNTPLQEVFVRINKTYHTSILFDSTQAKGRTFTGSFLKQEPVEEVLATIAQLNNLTVNKTESGYRLTTD